MKTKFILLAFALVATIGSIAQSTAIIEQRTHETDAIVRNPIESSATVILENPVAQNFSPIYPFNAPNDNMVVASPSIQVRTDQSIVEIVALRQVCPIPGMTFTYVDEQGCRSTERKCYVYCGMSFPCYDHTEVLQYECDF